MIVGAQRFDCLNDAERVDPREHPRLFAMTDETTCVSERQDHRPSHREKLRKFSWQSIVVKRVIPSWLDQDIGQAKDARNLAVIDVAKVDRNLTCPGVVGPK